MKERVKNWFHNNWLGFGVIILLLLILFTSIYFLENKQKIYYQQQTEKCMVLGDKYVEENYKKGNDTTQGVLSSEYHFNKKLNSCLVFVEVITDIPLNSGKTWSTDYGEVIDLFSNKPLIQSTINNANNATIAYMDRNEFENQKLVLMSE